MHFAYRHKKLKMPGKRYYFISLNIRITIFVFLLLLFGFNKASAIDGPHGDERIRSPKGECATCHIPHDAKGKKIWAISGRDNHDLYQASVRQLCQTCHDGTMFYSGSLLGQVDLNGYENDDYPPPYEGEDIVETLENGEKEVYASTGIFDVFLRAQGPYESHVMHGAVEIDPKKSRVLIDYDKEVFPLDPDDVDIYPERAPKEYRSGLPGFYCGTCHNPHNQPDGEHTGGFYLRTKKGKGVGKSWVERKPFCAQCHGEFHFSKLDCLDCHHPHLGRTLIVEGNKEQEIIGRKILRFPVRERPFQSLPNVPEINDDPYLSDDIRSSICYCCHNGSEDNFLTKAGAVIPKIFGDDLGSEKKEHHPMGTQAALGTSDIFKRAKGTPQEFLNKNNQLTCTSCHDSGNDGFLHGHGEYKGISPKEAREKNKRNNFLRWHFISPEGENDPQSTDPSDDAARFCLRCHYDTDKDMNSFKGKHVQNRAGAFSLNIKRIQYIPDPNVGSIEIETGSANCMFCHFVHNGQERSDESPEILIRPDVDALMRIPSIAYNYNKEEDDDLNDYEGLCFGCHSDKNIVKGLGAGSYLSLEYYSHPFKGEPTFTIINDPNSFHISDGEGMDICDDYGTEKGNIYCGTCHEVHNGNNVPYLRYNSPYKAYGFCEGCHIEDISLATTHPIDRGPNTEAKDGAPTAEEFRDNLWGKGKIFSSGGSGKPGGITAPYDIDNAVSEKGAKGNVICLTCHNVHAAETSSKGEVEKDMNPIHGQLLVMDNYPVTSATTDGDEICKACHDSPSFPSANSINIGINGKHYSELKRKNEKGICQNCHIPHRAKTKLKIWALDVDLEFGEFTGMHELCYSCHNSNPPLELDIVSGLDNVFKKGEFENHVMFGGAVIKPEACPDPPVLNIDLEYQETFPLDPNDKDTIPNRNNGAYCGRARFSYNKGGKGFYCGTCHNPHNDPGASGAYPNLDIDGDYLRFEENQVLNKEDYVGTKGKRKHFCIQCHEREPGKFHFHGSDCLACHHPHRGATLIESEDNEKIGRLILLFSASPKSFVSFPNVPEIKDTDDPNVQETSSFCYGCHNKETKEKINPQAIEGIKVIYGDDAGDDKKEHHPMGTEADSNDPEKFAGGKFLRAPGLNTSNNRLFGDKKMLECLSKNGQITCISCHDGMHGLGPFKDDPEGGEKSKANKFLRGSLNEGNEKDKTDFCCECHSDKSESKLSGKHLITAGNNKRGGCMFCHFIHDGDAGRSPEKIRLDGGIEVIRPDIDCLLRESSVNLVWGDKTGDEDDYDYEDLCYGCHGNEGIAGKAGEGSLLDPAGYFTHPFGLQADPNLIAEGYTVSDGEGINVPDDYGAEKGHIYCGTCHDVHDNNTIPYLGGHKSAYEPYSFCEECHAKDKDFLPRSHPIDRAPNPDPAPGSPIRSEFTDTYSGGGPIFSQGGSGRPGGVTYPFDAVQGKSKEGAKGKVVCLTCHNVHAAVTSWHGTTKVDTIRENHGYLLVKDNNKNQSAGRPGSELCKACHPFGKTEYEFPSGDHGARNLPGTEWGICNACHTPHYSQGPKLWARPYYTSGPFKGTRQLCFTCHNRDGIARTGSWSVFKGARIADKEFDPNYREDHVMRNWADIDSPLVIYDPNFPLDPNAEDVIPTKCQKQTGQHDGIYCGSCMNPHIYQDKGYLRRGRGGISLTGARKNLCISCHYNLDHYPDQDCMDCHNPHGGLARIDDDPNCGDCARQILIGPCPQARAFRAKPNVEDFTGKDISSKCYGCHGPDNEKNPSLWTVLGATVIYGDTEAQGNGEEPGWMPKEHHPMGNQARFGQSLRAPGADRSLFNREGELTCTSCHTGSHTGERGNNFLRWDFTNDNPNFCINKCHNDKQGIFLGPVGWGHHQTKLSSPLKRKVTERPEKENIEVETRCANCMFCHFIHDGDSQGDTLTPALDTLMRIKPVNFRAADAWDDEDALDYEDICYGCHSKEYINNGAGGLGSLLIASRDKAVDTANDQALGRRFSHRFRSAPNITSPTSARLLSGGTFPVSDGKGERIINDYGTSAGRMFCGTCHNVHSWAANPGAKYLRGMTSPYVLGGFCFECHSEESIPNVCTMGINHPLIPPPDPLKKIPVSVLEWPPVIYSNVDPSTSKGKGARGGFVSVQYGQTPNFGCMTCLTCHNMHAAETTYDGHADQPHSNENAIVDGRHGKLLIIDNGNGPAGSDLCIVCHPDHSQIIGSPHDFSHKGIDGLGAGIAEKGICSACHIPHMALDDKLFWARPLIEEELMFGSVPGFALGSTLFCYDCHSGVWCDNNPRPELFLPFPPQDIAFVDGPGGIIAGYYEPLPDFVQDLPPHRLPNEIKTSGHYIKQPIATLGIMQNFKLPCNDCHNPHRGITKDGIPNQAFIKEILGGKPIGPYKASINMVYHKEIRDNLESRRACVACHGLSDRLQGPIYPPSLFMEINPQYSSPLPISRPSATVYEHFDLGIYPCTDCHRHNRARILCIDCHGYPPIRTGNGWSGPGDPDQNYQGGAGAHYRHVIEEQFACTMCHLGCLHDPGGATVVNPIFKRAKVSLDFDSSYKFPRTSGEFRTKMEYPELSLYSQYKPENQTCKTGCHNPLIGDPDEPPNLDNWTPGWSLQVPLAPTPPVFPTVLPPDWIVVRTPYPVPITIPGPWQIPLAGQ